MYEYQPLQTPTSTRLLVLHPAGTTHRISCSLLQTDLSAKPVYEALSYVWGERANPVEIVCDGSELEVTQNLAAALRQLRPSDVDADPRVLWVDAICINQEDIPEREQQVRIMGEVYQGAASVLVWLGEEPQEGGFENAWACMKDMAERVWPRRQELIDWNTGFMRFAEVESTRDGQRKRNMSQMIRDPQEINRYFDIKPADSHEFQAIGKIFRRSWFSRAWTFQEHFLATQRVFHCGRFSMSGQEMTRIHEVLMELRLRTADNRYFEDDLKNTFGMLQGRDFWVKNPKNRLLELLDFRRGAGCERPSDLIYSLLGSVKNAGGIEVDYSKTFEQVFTDIAFRHMTSYNNLSILGWVDSDAPPSSLPRWVPDLRARTNHRQFTDLFFRRYNSTGNSKLEARMSPCTK